MKLEREEIERRAQRAEELFREGFNCSQSVVGAWADYYGLDFNLAIKLAASFGGGIGRMRETCGAACGMFILAGLETGCTDPKNRDGKSANYKVVQQLAASFVEQNGYLKCGAMLENANAIKNEEISYRAKERNEEYYKKRPCPEIVRGAAKIYGEFLLNLSNDGEQK